MAKDPAFLFYSKDWIEGTAEMLPQEKGVYIDLLCYQHQKGDLPSDANKLARLSRLPIDEFEKIWLGLKDKFTPIGTPNGERLVNRKLTEVVNERSDRSSKNKLIGTFAHVLKKLNLSKNEQKILKSRFNVDELLKINTEWSTERLTEWCLNGIPFIEDEDANEDANEDKEKGGVGEKGNADEELIYPFSSDEFKKQWLVWKDYKKKEHKFSFKTIQSEQASLKKLSEISNGNEEIAIEIIHQSLANGWKGLFELKNNGKTTKTTGAFRANPTWGKY